MILSDNIDTTKINNYDNLYIRDIINRIIILNNVLTIDDDDIIDWIDSFNLDMKETYNILYNNYFFDRSSEFLLSKIKVSLKYRLKKINTIKY